MRGRLVPAGEGRTFWGIAGDMFFFGVGASLTSQTTVVPSFLATLTSSSLLIGLASTLATGGWLVPQLFAANRLAGLTRRKSAVTIPAIVNRSVSLLVGPAIVLLVPVSRPAALVAFYGLYLAFWVVDGIASVAWLDYLGRCLSAPSRARLISLGTITPGIVGVGGGALVGVVLSTSRLSWPANYALLFLGSGVLYSLSLGSFFIVKDPPVSAKGQKMPWPAYFACLVAVMQSDPSFRRAVLAAIFLGGLGVAAPFYIVHGLESLGFPVASVGFFTSVQLIGSVVATLILGLMGERRGTRAVMRACCVAALAAPAIAVAAPLLSSALPGAVMYIYSLVFVVVGTQGAANMAGFQNWVLEYAPPGDRPMYIGFANTLNGFVLVMPMIGGWILSASASWPDVSYPLLFTAAAVGPAAALFLLRKLPEPRTAALALKRPDGGATLGS
jgi:hypothetical protein